MAHLFIFPFYLSDVGRGERRSSDEARSAARNLKISELRVAVYKSPPFFPTHLHSLHYLYISSSKSIWVGSATILTRLRRTIRYVLVLSRILALTVAQVTSAPHKAALSHELIAAAASYEVRRCLSFPRLALADRASSCQAAKAYEKHCAENGQPESHAKAKELFAAFSGAFVDRMVETKGVCAICSNCGYHGILTFCI
jgi:hypothetical protein